MTRTTASVSGSHRATGFRLAALATLVALLVALGVGATGLGSSEIGAGDVFRAIFAFDGSRDHLVVTTIRLPRILAGALAGAALAVAGAIMQAMTGNALASPDLLGINAGAAFAVVIALSAFGAGAHLAFVWCAFGGAALAAAVIYAFGASGWGSATPLKLLLAGAVLNAFLFSLTTAVLIFDQSTLDTVRLWTAGSLVGRSMKEVVVVAPYLLAGLAASSVLARQLTTMSLGADTARALGQNTQLWRGAAAAIVVVLAGGAVALAGPIGFVGLVVPHVVRMSVGADYRWVVPFCAVAGALLVLLADTFGRTAFGSQVFPVGVTMALIGAPFFIWLARRRAGRA